MYSERIDNQNPGIPSEDMPGSAAACPGGPAPPSGTPIVEAQHLNSSEFRSLQVHTAAREPEPANLPVPRTEGVFSGAKEDRGRMRALA